MSNFKANRPGSPTSTGGFRKDIRIRSKKVTHHKPYMGAGWRLMDKAMSKWKFKDRIIESSALSIFSEQ